MNTNKKINQFLYAGFTALGLYYIISNQVEQAPIFLGIALAFDPFDEKTTWQKRPQWQKAVLVIHIAVVAALFGYIVGFYDK